MESKYKPKQKITNQYSVSKKVTNTSTSEKTKPKNIYLEHSHLIEGILS